MILIDTVFRTGKNCYPQVFVSTLSKQKRYVNISSDKENSDERKTDAGNSDAGNSDEGNYTEEQCLFKKTIYMKKKINSIMFKSWKTSIRLEAFKQPKMLLTQKEYI